MSFARTPSPMLITPGTSLTQWPAIPNGFNASVLSLMYQLEATQWWRPEQLEAMQLAQLSRLIAHFAATSPVFAARIADTGYSRGAIVTREMLARFPVLGRQDLQALGDTLNSRAVPADHGGSQPCTTSGSLGTPVTVLRTQVNRAFHQAFNLRNHVWHKREFNTCYAILRGFPHGESMYPSGNRSMGWSPYVQSGAGIALNTAYCTLAEQVAFLQREQPNYLLTYPTNLAAIAAFCRDNHVTLPSLRGLATFSEAIYPSQRALVREVFDLSVADMYSSAELGMIAIQCPEHEHQHVQSEGVLVEILDDDNNPCGEGVTGHLVITDLHNAASPMVRYRVGDMAAWGAPCPCGRGLPVLARVYGRVRNMMRLRNGDVIFPDVAAHRLGQIGPVQQSQVIQRGYDDIELKLALKRPMTSDEKQEILSALRTSLGRPFNIRINIVEEIPRSAGGKFEDFICAFDATDAGRRDPEATNQEQP